MPGKDPSSLDEFTCDYRSRSEAIPRQLILEELGLIAHRARRHMQLDIAPDEESERTLNVLVWTTILHTALHTLYNAGKEVGEAALQLGLAEWEAHLPDEEEF